MARPRYYAAVLACVTGLTLVCGTVAANAAPPPKHPNAGLAPAGLTVSGAAANRLNPFTGLGTTIDSFDAVQGMTHHLKNGNTDPSGGSPGRLPPPGWDADLFTTKQAMSPGNVAHLKTSGVRPLSYRLVTELREEDWHWNPVGSLSAGDHGYWTSNPNPSTKPITESYGYNIAHGGSSIPGGENAYVSRLDDGDTNTYWKSNPYLDQHFTGDPNRLHPAWAVVDLGSVKTVNTVEVDWANPYAVSYDVQRWVATAAAGHDQSPFDHPVEGSWQTLPGGAVTHGTGGMATIRVHPTPARFVRVLMDTSSGTCAGGDHSDIRNCLGFAIYELYVGSTSSGGTFTDYVRHRNGVKQSYTYTSSNDPAEGASSIRQFDQPGVDELFTSGVTQGLPMMVPVPLIYSTPENAVGLLRYLEAKGYKIGAVEIGEECDGEYMSPEDYAALYLEWAKAIHAFDPTLKLGGPALQSNTAKFWTDTPVHEPTGDFGRRFIAYLKSHNALSDLNFYSFEQYPVFNVSSQAQYYTLLLNEPARDKGVMAHLHATIPAGIPLYVTEQSAYSDSVVPGLWEADYIAGMFTDGLDGNFNYQALPQHLFSGTASNMFTADYYGQWTGNTSQYFAFDMLGNRWFAPVNATQRIYRVQVPAIRAPHGQQLLTAYAIHQPDGDWSLMVINKSQTATYREPVSIDGHGFTGQVSSYSWGQAQYRWHQHGDKGYASPDNGPALTTISAGPSTAYTFLPLTITVVRGKAG
ncbi:MAG TPA: discoidin domain-containing protein [Streptosporangiaceae bacterium]|nr:discoidin domain-containing protein [Streptosporangiaceae bacterium]